MQCISIKKGKDLKMKPEVYANSLKRTNGLQQATKIAEHNMKNTMPSEWNGVVNKEGSSTIFTVSKRPGKFERDKICLPKLNNFWKHVYHILKKETV